MQRKVFGKPLHSQAVIRAKLAGMISRAESMHRRVHFILLEAKSSTGCQSWLENITYQMCNMVSYFLSALQYYAYHYE